jgi:predicted nucleotidyltransferase
MAPAEIEERVLRNLVGDDLQGIVSIYLFGSFAEGRSHRESDVDLGVALRRESHPTAARRFDRRLQLAGRLSAAFDGRPADIVILNDAPPHLARRIVTRGRRLFCADERADRALVRDVQLRAADLDPFLRRMREIKLKALGRA